MEKQLVCRVGTSGDAGHHLEGHGNAVRSSCHFTSVVEHLCRATGGPHQHVAHFCTHDRSSSCWHLCRFHVDRVVYAAGVPDLGLVWLNFVMTQSPTTDRPTPQVPRVIASGWRIAPWWLIQRRRTQQQSLLKWLATIYEQRLDAPTFILALADEHRGGYRHRLMKLASRLHAGTSLVDAIEQTDGLLDREIVLELRVAAQSGTLGEALRAYQDSRQLGSDDIRADVWQAAMYFVAMMGVILLVINFMSAFIAPVMHDISEEFGLPSSISSNSKSLNTLSSFANFIQSSLPTILLILLAIAAGRFVLNRYWGWRPRKYFGIWRLFAVIPGFQRRRGAGALSIIAKTLQTGRPLPGTMSSLARYHPDPRVRRGLLLARNEIEQGSSLWDSLVAAKLLSAKEAAVVSTMETSQLQAWTIEKLAEKQQEQGTRRKRILATFAHPLAVIICGAFVLWITVAYFGVLVRLIHGVH